MLDALKKVIEIGFPMTDILFADRSAQGLGHIYRAGCEKQVFFQNQVMLQQHHNPLVTMSVCPCCIPVREPRRDIERAQIEFESAAPKEGCCHVVLKLDACSNKFEGPDPANGCGSSVLRVPFISTFAIMS